MRYCLVTDFEYPNGGGEEFGFETIKLMKSLGYECFWITFKNENNHKLLYIYNISNNFNQWTEELKEYCEYQVFDRKVDMNIIKTFIKKTKISVLHYIGKYIKEISNIDFGQVKQVFVGMHYWDDFLEYTGKLTYSKEVLKTHYYGRGGSYTTKEMVTETEDLDENMKLLFSDILKYKGYAVKKISPNKNFTYYVPSKYAEEVFKKFNKNSQFNVQIINPIIPKFSKIADVEFNFEYSKSTYVTFLSINYYKSGRKNVLKYINYIYLCYPLCIN